VVTHLFEQWDDSEALACPASAAAAADKLTAFNY